MSIFQGTSELELYQGTNEIGVVYQGSTEIWTNAQAIDLGTGTSFNIQTLLPSLDYTTLTADNFFFVYPSTTSYSHTNTSYPSAGSSDVYAKPIKTYNATTGVLSAYYRYYYYQDSASSRSDSAVRVYLVKDVSKLTNLGSGKSFSVSSLFPTKYTSFTANNFLLSTLPSPHGYSLHRAGVGFTKSYNSSTGVLSCYGSSSGDDPETSSTYNVGTMYLAPKVNSL